MRPFLALLAAVALAACGDADPEPTEPMTEGLEQEALTPAPADAGRQSVATLVSESPRLSTLARLVAATELDATLADTATTYTLFAPSDAAFAALGEERLAGLEADPEAAREVLLAHVLPTRMLSVDVFPDLAIESLAGTEIAFVETDQGLAVRSLGTTAQITDADLDADNGVVHILDQVLIDG